MRAVRKGMPEYQTNDHCSNCGEPVQRVKGNYLFRESGLSNIVLKNIEVMKCAHCGNQDPVIPRLTELIRFLAAAVVKQPCPLAGEQIRFLRKQLDKNGETFARLIGVDKTTLSKWENNQISVGPNSDRLIRAVVLALGPESKAELEKAVLGFTEIDDRRESV